MKLPQKNYHIFIDYLHIIGSFSKYTKQMIGLPTELYLQNGWYHRQIDSRHASKMVSQGLKIK